VKTRNSFVPLFASVTMGIWKSATGGGYTLRIFL
jgi:hypothetical protein